MRKNKIPSAVVSFRLDTQIISAYKMMSQEEAGALKKQIESSIKKSKYYVKNKKDISNQPEGN